MPTCILCKRTLEDTTTPGLLTHPDVEDCLVRVTDSFGVSLDHVYEIVNNEIWAREDRREEDRIIEVPTFKPTEDALLEIFSGAGIERLGGKSSGSGWSNVSLFQRCRYAWKARYQRKPEDRTFMGESIPMAVGTLVHTYLAIYYQRMIVPSYPLMPDDVDRGIRGLGCNPEVAGEAWRLFSAYRLFYKNEAIEPLAIEYDLVDPRTSHSCRFDLIAFFRDEKPGRLPGTYNVEHKTASRFDQNTIEGWLGDGEILGQVDLWDRLHLDRRFGKLRGVLVNLIGKQKVPEFHRTLAAPSTFAIDQHRKDLRYWNAEIQGAVATGVFPRSRANCIHRYGRCEWWDHCNLGEEL